MEPMEIEIPTLPRLPETLAPLTWDSPTFGPLRDYISLAVKTCRPNGVVIFDGSADSYHQCCEQLVKDGVFIPVSQYLFPNSYLVRSNPIDVARSEDRTFMCGPEAGRPYYRVPNSAIDPEMGFNWGCRMGETDPETGRDLTTEQMRERMIDEFTGCMEGRTMYVIPFSMAPISSRFAKFGVEITDSLYVVANMFLMTRTGTEVLRFIGAGSSFVPCWHSVGCPVKAGEKDVPWPCRLEAERRYITQFTTRDPKHPQLGNYSIMSIGSGYGGNALLGKKCYALRIAMCMALHDNPKWMAEHMLILHVSHTPCIGKDAKGKKIYGPARHYYISGAFPSACGKTNLAMIEVPKQFADEWKITCLGDDIAWIRMDEQGRLCATNPESGFFGVAPGTSDKSNSNAMQTLRRGNTIFTNVGVTLQGDVWWADKTKEMPLGLIDWKGVLQDDNAWRDADPVVEKKKKKAVAEAIAQKNSRYTTPCSQCPVADVDWNSGRGVPLDAIFFGGRRRSLMPLVYRAPTWEQGVLAGATLRSEQTAAAQDRPEGALTFDPMAMRPFIGYNMGEYFDHWFEMGRLATHHPAIYCVNWFRRLGGALGNPFLWEGFSQNFRVIKWACENAQAERDYAGSHGAPPRQALTSANTVVTPLGILPRPAALGLDLSKEGDRAVLANEEPLTFSATDAAGVEWFNELCDRKRFLDLLHEDLSDQMKREFNTLVDGFLHAGMTVPVGRHITEVKY